MWGDSEVGEDADDLLGWRPGRFGPAVEDAVGQRDALVDDQLAGVGGLGELDDDQVGLLGVDGVLQHLVGQFVDAGREQARPAAWTAHSGFL